MIRVQLPYHLQTLARVGREVEIQIEGVATLSLVIDALETQYPMLRGTIRDYVTGQRRDFIRFFACGQDMSLDPLDTPLPDAVAAASEPFRIVGAMAGG
ncbi:MAG: MoaD/ThiS family protein [Chloroflexi bacterium]|nr:MoaD/ThiS family protein [Chloroflexota bacterium]